MKTWMWLAIIAAGIIGTYFICAAVKSDDCNCDKKVDEKKKDTKNDK